MEVDDEASPVPLDPAPPEQPVSVWRSANGSSSSGSVRDFSEHDDTLDHSGLADAETPELMKLLEPSDTSIISETSSYSTKAEPALSRDGIDDWDETNSYSKKSDVVVSRRRLRKPKIEPEEPAPNPRQLRVRRQKPLESKTKKLALKVEEPEPEEAAPKAREPEPMEKEQEEDLEESGEQEEQEDPDEPTSEESESNDNEPMEEDEEEEEESEDEELEQEEPDNWWDKTEEELDKDFEELEAWVEAGGTVKISRKKRAELRALVHTFYPFPFSTLDEPERKFTMEEQMVPYERVGPDYKGELEYPPQKLLKVNLRVIRTPNPPFTQEDLDRMKPIAPISANYRVHCLAVDPEMLVGDLIGDIHSNLKLDRQTLDVYLFSKGRQLRDTKTLREVCKQQEREESLAEEHGKFFLDVQIFERFERPPLIMITAPNTYYFVRRRARSAPPLDDPPKKRRLSESKEDEVEEIVESEEEEETQFNESEQVPQLEEQIPSEDGEEEFVDLQSADIPSTSTIKPIVPPQYIPPAEPEDDSDDDDEEMPALSAEEPMQTEQLQHQSEPLPVQPLPGFHYHNHQNYQDYRHMLRERERIRRRGPRAPKENVSTTYHELTPPAPRYPNGYPVRPPAPMPSFRFEGPIPFDAKVNVLSTEFRKSPEEIKRMSPEEVDRLFNQIATSHIAKNQQLQHQQQQILHAQKMQMRQNHGMSRTPLPLPVRIGSFPPGHPGNRPNIRLPPGAPAGLINRLVPVMMPIAPGHVPSGPLPPQMVQQMIAQHQAAAMAARYAQKQKEEAAAKANSFLQPSSSQPSSSQPSTSSAPVAKIARVAPTAPMAAPVTPVVKATSSEKIVRLKESPEGAEKSTRAEKRKRPPCIKRTPCYLGPSTDTEVRNHFVSVVSPYYPSDSLMPWMHHPVNRNGAINVPNTICALTEFIELCESQNADPSRFLENYYLADQSPKYRQMLNTVDYNIHVTRRRCDLGDVRIPQLDAEQQLRLYLMRFEADEQRDEKWREFYRMMQWPFPPDGKFPKGKKIDAPGHLSVNLAPRAPRMKTSQPMKPEEKEILERAIKTAQADQLAQLKVLKGREKSPEGKRRTKSNQKRNSIQTDLEPHNTVPNAEFLQSLAPSFHRDMTPESFGEEEHSQTSSDVTSSDGVRPSSNTSSNAQDDVTNNAGSGQKVQNSSAVVVSKN